MKKNEIIGCALIAIGLTLTGIVWWFSELGIAAAFGLTYKGVPYVEYALGLTKHAWWWSLTIGMMIAVVSFGTWTIYRSLKNGTKN